MIDPHLQAQMSLLARGRIRRFALICLVVQLVFAAYALVYFKWRGYLPPPFFFASSDTFMDFFHVNYWSWRDGVYDQWRSIYTLFVFALARQLGSPDCLATEPMFMRSCDIANISYLFVSYCVAAGLSASVFLRELGDLGYRRYVTWSMWFLVVFLCMPGLFGLERGNYIVVAFMMLAVFAWGGYSLATAFCLAFAILVKQYLVVLLVVPLLKRRFDFLAQCGLMLVVLMLWAYMVYPHPHWSMLFENMFGYATSDQFSAFERLWYPTSFVTWERVWPRVLAYSYGEAAAGTWANVIEGALAAMGVFVKLLALAAMAVMAWRHRRLRSSYMFFLVLLTLVVVSDSPLVYAMMLLLPFLPGLMRQGLSAWQMLWLLMAFLPLSAIQQPFGPQRTYWYTSFLSGQDVWIDAHLQIGAILHPLGLLCLLCSMLMQMLLMSPRVNDEPEFV